MRRRNFLASLAALLGGFVLYIFIGVVGLAYRQDGAFIAAQIGAMLFWMLAGVAVVVYLIARAIRRRRLRRVQGIVYLTEELLKDRPVPLATYLKK